MRNQFFSQYELEFAIGQQLEYGNDTDLAERLGVSPGIVSQYLNHGDSRESPVYKAACILAEWIDLNPDGGHKALELFNLHVRRAEPKDLVLNVEKTRERAYKETAEYYLAEAANKTRENVKRELIDSIFHLQQHLEAIEAEERKSKRETAAVKTLGRFGRNGK